MAAEVRGELFDTGVEKLSGGYAPTQYVATPATDYSGVIRGVGQLAGMATNVIEDATKQKTIDANAKLVVMITKETDRLRVAREQGKLTDKGYDAKMSALHSSFMVRFPEFANQISEQWGRITGIDSKKAARDQTPAEKERDSMIQELTRRGFPITESTVKALQLENRTRDQMKYDQEVWTHDKNKTEYESYKTSERVISNMWDMFNQSYYTTSEAVKEVMAGGDTPENRKAAQDLLNRNRAESLHAYNQFLASPLFMDKMTSADKDKFTSSFNKLIDMRDELTLKNLKNSAEIQKVNQVMTGLALFNDKASPLVKANTALTVGLSFMGIDPDALGKHFIQNSATSLFFDRRDDVSPKTFADLNVYNDMYTRLADAKTYEPVNNRYSNTPDLLAQYVNRQGSIVIDDSNVNKYSSMFNMAPRENVTPEVMEQNKVLFENGMANLDFSLSSGKGLTPNIINFLGGSQFKQLHKENPLPTGTIDHIVSYVQNDLGDALKEAIKDTLDKTTLDGFYKTLPWYTSIGGSAAVDSAYKDFKSEVDSIDPELLKKTFRETVEIGYNKNTDSFYWNPSKSFLKLYESKNSQVVDTAKYIERNMNEKVMRTLTFRLNKYKDVLNNLLNPEGNSEVTQKDILEGILQNNTSDNSFLNIK